MRRNLFALAAAFVLTTQSGVEGCEDDDDCVDEGQDLHLTGGQTIPVGGVHVDSADGILSVSYGTTDGWLLDEVHLHVGCDRAEIPTSGSGGPSPGQFDHSASFSPGVNTHTFEVDLSTLSCAAACGDELVLAVHATVSNAGTGASETAWASSFDPNDPAADAASWEFGGSRCRCS